MGRFDLGSHLGQLELDGLVLRDRLAESVTLLGIGDTQLERTLCDTATTCRHVDAADLDSVHHLVKPSASGAAKYPIGRNAKSVHDELGRVDALVAHLVDLPGNGEAGADLSEAGLLLDQEGRHRLVGRGALRVSFVTSYEHGHQVRRAAVRQPHLLTVQDVLVAVPDRLRGDRGDVRAERLRHRERAAHLAQRHPGQEVVLLLLRAVLLEHVRHDEVRVDDAGDRHPAAGDLLDAERVGEEGLAQAPVLLGDHQAEQAQLLEAVDDLLGVLVAVLQLGRDRDDLLVHEVANGGEDLLLDVGETGGLGESRHGYFSCCLSSGRPGCSPPRSLMYVSVGTMTLRRNTHTSVPSCL